MTCKKFYSRALLTALLMCSCTTNIFPETRRKTVIFDWNGVLGESSRWGTIKEIGLGSIMLYLLSGNNPTRLSHTLFDVLEHCYGPQKITGRTAYGDGQPLPEIMCAWLRGDITGPEIAHQTCLMIDYGECDCLLSSPFSKRCLKRILRTVFDPVFFAKNTTLIPEGIDLVRACKAAGHNVLILSNLDAESFPELVRCNPEAQELVALINDTPGKNNIIISGDIGLIKPDPAIFDYVIKTYGVRPEDCCLIDDQKENIDAAHTAGFNAIWLKNYDYVAVQNSLVDLKIFSPEINCALA